MKNKQKQKGDFKMELKQYEVSYTEVIEYCALIKARNEKEAKEIADLFNIYEDYWMGEERINEPEIMEISESDSYQYIDEVPRLTVNRCICCGQVYVKE